MGRACEGQSFKNITPFWRVIDERSKVAAKLACGAEKIAELRKGKASCRKGRIKAKGV